MKNILRLVSDLFSKALKGAFPEHEIRVIVSKGKNPKHGDYQCNNAMGAFKMLKKSGAEDCPSNPREAAQRIMDNLPDNDLIAKCEVAGPGFINVYLNKEFVVAQIQDVLKNGVTPPDGVTPKVAVVDFSSPNIAKEMHVGHLRSTIIGEALCRFLEFQGHKVHRTNHVGDWGTQFGMLTAHLQDEHPDFDTNPPPIADLQAFYKAAKKRFDDDADFKKRAHDFVVALQSGSDPKVRAGWQLICDVSRKEFEKIYERLHITLEEKGESFYNPFLKDTVKLMQEAGLCKESDGAQCVWVDNPKQPKAEPVPLIVEKSDGGFTYATTDLAALNYRANTLNADMAYYVIDSGQSTHLELVYEAGRRAKLYDPAKTRVEHVGFGVVLGEDGKKFKTRSGDVVKLVDLLDEAVVYARKTLDGKIDEKKAELAEKPEELAAYEASLPAEEELQRRAWVVGHSAVKYADLKNNRLSNYQFSFKRMMNLKGNTAVYMLYAYARINSINAKADVDVNALIAAGDLSAITVEHPKEYALARAVLRFAEEMDLMNEDLLPSRMCDYVYELSTVYSDFYQECRVLGNASRLMLSAATQQVMRQGLDLLGIEYLEQM